MVFSSPIFMFAFLPIVFIVYFLLNKQRLFKAGKFWLVLASFFFYGYWSVAYIPLMLGSIIFNYIIGSECSLKTKHSTKKRKIILAFGIIVNILVLGHYKYSNFFIDNLNQFVGTHFQLAEIILPLGISFYTFTQIAFLVDSYKGKATEYDFVNYTLFVTFFPHLIAGPILHHKEMMSQFASKWNLTIKYKNILLGLMIFGIGLFKKVALADMFAEWANLGFLPGYIHNFYSAWVTSLSYTFQLYFDFSGYCDMAIGAALLFNIWLPINFFSPYKSLDIQDFWRRWHITLGRYLRDYIYIPLGGNRAGELRTYFNLALTFVIGGLWHGASWMFIIWGAMHGAALVIHRFWSKTGWSLPKPVAWFITFMFVNIAWIFFRAHSVEDATRIISTMFNLDSLKAMDVANVPINNLSMLGVHFDYLYSLLPAGIAGYAGQFFMIVISFIIMTQKNSIEIVLQSKITYKSMISIACLTVIAMYFSLKSTSTVFLYFNF